MVNESVQATVVDRVECGQGEVAVSWYDVIHSGRSFFVRVPICADKFSRRGVCDGTIIEDERGEVDCEQNND